MWLGSQPRTVFGKAHSKVVISQPLVAHTGQVIMCHYVHYTTVGSSGKVNESRECTHTGAVVLQTTARAE